MNLNMLIVEGELLTDVSYTTTDKRGDAAGSFILCIDRSNSLWNKIRVNVFGDRVKECQHKKLGKGSRVVVFGEIMTRICDGVSGATARIYTNDVRALRVIGSTEEEPVHSIRQSLSDQLSLEKTVLKRSRGE